MTVLSGTVLLDRYQLQAKVGRGGTGPLGRRWEVEWIGPLMP